ncbi:MAG: hypothetical protein AAGF06_06320 [Pseudomonadota bacterium]
MARINVGAPQRELTKYNHQAFFERFLKRRDTQLSRFEAAINAEYGDDTLNYSPESLECAWAAVKAKLSVESFPDGYTDENRVPEWYWYLGAWLQTLAPTQALSYESLDWLDQLMYYAGEVVIHNVPDTRWVQHLDVSEKYHSNLDYWPAVANYSLDGKARNEGYSQYIYLGIRLDVSKHFKGEESEVCSIKRFYDDNFKHYHNAVAMCDEDRYGDHKVSIFVTGFKFHEGWQGCDETSAKDGYYTVRLGDHAKKELGAEFKTFDQRLESVDGIDSVAWCDLGYAKGFQVATKLGKKELNAVMRECYMGVKDAGSAKEKKQVNALRVRQVTPEDEEISEEWEVISTNADRWGVCATRMANEDEFAWNVTVSVVEFIRDEALEIQLHRAIKEAMSEVPGVKEVAEQDRGLWIIDGQPDGSLLVESVLVVLTMLESQISNILD